MSEVVRTVAGWIRALRSGLRLGKFVSVGAIGAICDTAVLLVLVEGFGVLEEVAALAGIEASILLMFVLNERWTFPDSGRRSGGAVLRRLGRSHLVRSGGVVVQFALFVAVYRLLFVPVQVAGVDAWLVVAKLAGIAVGTLLNYVFESLFTWRVQQP